MEKMKGMAVRRESMRQASFKQANETGGLAGSACVVVPCIIHTQRQLMDPLPPAPRLSAGGMAGVLGMTAGSGASAASGDAGSALSLPETVQEQ